MSNAFLTGLLSLAEADAEAALIPPAQTFLSALAASKTTGQRVAALAQLEGNAIAAAESIGPELLTQVLPQVNATLQSVLAKALAVQSSASTAKVS